MAAFGEAVRKDAPSPAAAGRKAAPLPEAALGEAFKKAATDAASGEVVRKDAPSPVEMKCSCISAASVSQGVLS